MTGIFHDSIYDSAHFPAEMLVEGITGNGLNQNMVYFISYNGTDFIFVMVVFNKLSHIVHQMGYYMPAIITAVLTYVPFSESRLASASQLSYASGEQTSQLAG